MRPYRVRLDTLRRSSDAMASPACRKALVETDAYIALLEKEISERLCSCGFAGFDPDCIAHTKILERR